MAIVTFELKLESIQQLTPGIRHLAFSRVDGQTLEFIPGQFINLYFEQNGKRQSRSYSIASIPPISNGKVSNKAPLVEIAISHIPGGLASESLRDLAIGQTITASGPVGRLVLKSDESPKRLILVGTGTGIAPYRSMLPVLEQRLVEQPELEVLILFGTRNREDCIYVEDFRAWAKTNPKAKFYACYSQEKVSDPEPDEWAGRVTSFLKEIPLNPTNDVVYLCGNPSMIDDAFGFLQHEGFDHKNVRREKYVFSHR